MNKLWEACTGPGAGVMAIINVTPDSFYDGSRSATEEIISRRVGQALEQGARILDVGGCSSRPGADYVEPEEEMRRVAMALDVIRRRYPGAVISIDTTRQSVAAGAIERYGDCIINDISAGEADPEMIPFVAAAGVPYIAMHMRGTPQTMATLTDYGDVADHVLDYLKEKIVDLRLSGIEKLVIDPGFGFAKTIEQNYRLLGDMHRLVALGCPVMAAISRKSMVFKVTGATAAESLPGTAALHWEALRQGATILRAHDVKAAADVIRLYEYYIENGK